MARDFISREKEKSMVQIIPLLLKRGFLRSLKYPKNELLTQILIVPHGVDKLTCPSVTFK